MRAAAAHEQEQDYRQHGRQQERCQRQQNIKPDCSRARPGLVLRPIQEVFLFPARGWRLVCQFGPLLQFTIPCGPISGTGRRAT
jgi:hypothetical protein